ncbi:MAG: DUF3575 domain-containing protein [Myxococcaceae bacterium]|nr:DUF3575 domain-containing protein [Myxococcaceae bacterium]
MRITTAVAAVLLTTSPALAQGQEVHLNPDRRGTHVITLAPVELFSGTFNIEYEHAVAPWVGLYGGVNFLAFRGVLSPGYDRTLSVGPEVGARFYLLGNAPAGLWLGPYLGAAYVSNTAQGISQSSFGWGVGAMAGVNLVLFHRLMLSFGAGTGWIDNSSSPAGYRVGLYGFVPRLRLAVGVAF